MKAILVLEEMPNSCPQCPCIDVEENSYGDVIRAECGNKYKGDISEYLEWENGRPSWCPLKPMPKKINRNRQPDEYADGYNWCIEEIENG